MFLMAPMNTRLGLLFMLRCCILSEILRGRGHVTPVPLVPLALPVQCPPLCCLIFTPMRKIFVVAADVSLILDCLPC